ncbi:MAG: kelch repeat-containing protein [Bacteroidota bacterium]
MRFLNFKLQIFCLITFLVIGISACRKPIVITNVVIAGPTTVCYGDTGVIFSVAPNPDPQGNTYILWTVPEQAQITSGHGTNIIKVDFGRIAGKIGVKYFSDGEEISEESFLEVKFDVQNKWCRELDFKAGIRTDGVGFSIGNKGYIGTGLGYVGVVTYYDDFWEFDPEFKTWTQKADLGGNGSNLNLGMERANAVGFSIGNKGYIGTGHKSSGISPDQYLKDFWEYNPVSNVWLRKADCGVTTRQFAVGFSIGNKGYVGSGQPGNTGILTDFWEYDPVTDLWTRKTDLLVPRFSGVGFSIGNKGYCGMGTNGSVRQNDFFEFDPSDASLGLDINGNPLGKWTAKQNVPSPGSNGSVGFSIENKGYIGTGFSGVYLKGFYEYDPNLNIWDTLPDFEGGNRGSAIGFSIGNKGYIGTGVTQTSILNGLKDFWVYTK